VTSSFSHYWWICSLRSSMLSQAQGMSEYVGRCILVRSTGDVLSVGRGDVHSDTRNKLGANKMWHAFKI
jgi:hypothetical protein